MKYLNTYKLFEELNKDLNLSEVNDIFLTLEDKGFKLSIKSPVTSNDLNTYIYITKPEGYLNRGFRLSEIKDELEFFNNYIKKNYKKEIFYNGEYLKSDLESPLLKSNLISDEFFRKYEDRDYFRKVILIVSDKKPNLINRIFNKLHN